MCDIHGVAVDTVVRHQQQPERQPLLDLSARVRERGVRHLDREGMRLAQETCPNRGAFLHYSAQIVSGNALPVTCNLNEGLVW